jgi:uncharacterized protein with HEPN domain
MSKKRDDTLYIKDILESIKAIEEYIKNIDYQQFIENRMIYSATIRELEIIGEASRKLSPDIKEKHTNIPWKMIAGTRDRLIHGYFGVNIDVVWGIVTIDLPVLKREVNKIKEEYFG